MSSIQEQHELDFRLYATIWFLKNNWETPEVQMSIFDYLDDDANWGDNKSKTLLLWRGLGKSTIVDMWVAYKLTQNPALRFLILSADKETAIKSSKDILSILRNHPLSKTIAPTYQKGRGTSLRADQFSVNGSTDRRNPSVRSMGVLSNVTGGRADYIIYDDVEVPKNSGTDFKRYELRKKLSESAHLLSPDIGLKLFVGTYHDSESIYDEQISNGSSFLRVPLLRNTTGEFPYIVGESQWPERFTDKVISDKQKACTGRAEFYSQYLLIPTSISESILDSTLFKTYTGSIDFKLANGHEIATLQNSNAEPIRLRSVTCWWDPAFSSSKGDDSVLAIVFTDDNGYYYIHNTTKLVGDPDEQCEQIKKTVLSHHIPIVCVETNGIGITLPAILIKHLEGTGIGVDGVHNPPSNTKNQRILRAYETLLYSGRLYVHESVSDGIFLNQIRDFNPSTTRNKDDFIDAVASCILREPIRIGSGNLFGDSSSYSSINTNWMAQGTYSFKLDGFSF